MAISIKNGHLIDPANHINEITDIHISDGLIAGIGRLPAGFKPASIIDGSGQYIFPGIIDLCVRLREPGEEYKATILSETRAAASGGITSMICPPDTFPIIDTPAMAYMIRNRAEVAGFADVHPLGALTVGLKGERLTDMATLIDAGCVGVSNALVAVENTLLMRRAMQYASTFDISVFLTPRDPWLQGNGVVHEGVVSTELGLPAIPEAAETVGVARDITLVETSGARAHFELISCERSVYKIKEAQQRNVPITASVSINHLTCTEDDIGEFDTQYKVMPPLRTKLDRKGLIQGVANGQIATICSDHQPHNADAKLAPFSEAATGMAGLDTLLSLSFSLVEKRMLDITTVIAALTVNPAKIAGLHRGSLGVGDVADLCLFDRHKRWQLNDTTMKSRGKNSPWIGKWLTGKVTLTIKQGNIIFSDTCPDKTLS